MLMALCCVATGVAHAEFFKIESVSAMTAPPRDGISVWYDQQLPTNAPAVNGFMPSLEVKLKTEQNIAGKDVYVRGYFYDESGKLLRACPQPSRAGKVRQGGDAMPVIFKKDAMARVFFQIPKELGAMNCHAVIVFGDKDEAVAMTFPQALSESSFDYPEKKLVEDRSPKSVKRKVAVDPLVQYVVRAGNPSAKVREMTLFLRMPDGVSDPSDLQGVLAICMLAGSVDAVKRELQKPEMTGDYDGLFSYANKHKLAMVVWGATSATWDWSRNYNEMTQKAFEGMEGSLNELADLWEKGIVELSEKYSIPQKDYLLWGVCGSAQWAHRLCLRKPDRFLGCYLLIPSSFDKPTPEASKVLWCLCTGELFGGYERAIKWYQECRAMNYPMIFKAFEGLGHNVSNKRSLWMAFKFFDFALTQKSLRDDYERIMSSRIDKMRYEASPQGQGPWSPLFKNPPFYGDIVNQELYPTDQVEMIPAGFRTPLPTKELADYWLTGK